MRIIISPLCFLLILSFFLAVYLYIHASSLNSHWERQKVYESSRIEGVENTAHAVQDSPVVMWDLSGRIGKK